MLINFEKRPESLYPEFYERSHKEIILDDIEVKKELSLKKMKLSLERKQIRKL